MNYIINYLKVMLVPLAIIILLPVVLAVSNLLGMKTYSPLVLVLMIITSIVSGFLLGRKANKRGWLNGGSFGLLLVFFLFIFSLIGKNHYALNSLIYYLIIIASCMVGSMFGIQKKSVK